MALAFVDRPVDQISPLPYTRAKGRPFAGIVLHHTATSTDPTVRYGGSWHWLVGRSQLYRDVAEDDIAHHCGATDRWRPPWVAVGPGTVSDINYCSIGIEITYAPQNGETPNDFQEATVKALIADIYARRGPLPVVGHGEVDLSRWPTEPHAFDWLAAGFGPRTDAGRFLQETDDMTPAQRQMLDMLTNWNVPDPAALQSWKTWGDQTAKDVEALRKEVAALKAAQQPAPTVTTVEVRFSDGSAVQVPPAP